jgi:hypothetical protein
LISFPASPFWRDKPRLSAVCPCECMTARFPA